MDVPEVNRDLRIAKALHEAAAGASGSCCKRDPLGLSELAWTSQHHFRSRILNRAQLQAMSALAVQSGRGHRSWAVVRRCSVCFVQTFLVLMRAFERTLKIVVVC